MTEPSRPPKPDELRGLATALDTLGYNEKAKPTLIAALRAAADCISEESARARELWLVLANLSFHCDGVLCTVPPPREVYNESFAVMDRLKPLYGPEAPK